MHVTMFIVLRLIKLSRFRAVFWYFIVIALFSLLVEGVNNRFFTLQFTNTMDLSCIKADLFFSTMMLPISNYFTSIISWIHIVFSIAIVISSVLPVILRIQLMSLFITIVLCCLIKKNGKRVLSHQY